MLRNVLQHDERAVTIEIIQKFVADYYQLKLGELKSRNNSKSIAMPRQIAMYLCKTLTNASLPEIGRSFGGKHHSTVIHSIRKIEDLRQQRRRFQHPYQQLHGVVPLEIRPSGRFSTAVARSVLRMDCGPAGARIYPPDRAGKPAAGSAAMSTA